MYLECGTLIDGTGAVREDVRVGIDAVVPVTYTDDHTTAPMDRQKLFALFFALLMVLSMVAYAASLI